MTEKLKVSREVADAIECVKRECYGFNATMNIHIKNGWTSEEKMPLSQLTAEQLATALIVGYEVEKTPHEKIAVIYKHHYPKSRDGSGSTQKYFSKGYVKGIKFTLEKLGITVKGVNDND